MSLLRTQDVGSAAKAGALTAAQAAASKNSFLMTQRSLNKTRALATIIRANGAFGSRRLHMRRARRHLSGIRRHGDDAAHARLTGIDRLHRLSGRDAASARLDRSADRQLVIDSEAGAAAG